MILIFGPRRLYEKKKNVIVLGTLVRRLLSYFIIISILLSDRNHVSIVVWFRKTVVRRIRFLYTPESVIT